MKRRNLYAVFFSLLAFTLYWLIIGKVQICIFRMMFGIPCPGCGLTHAGIAMLRGHWKESFFYHPLLLPALFVFAVAIFRRVRPFSILFGKTWFFLSLFILFVLVYAVRMILYFPGGPYPMIYDKSSLLGVAIKLCFPAG